jgi:hypothetical protein
MEKKSTEENSHASTPSSPTIHSARTWEISRSLPQTMAPSYFSKSGSSECAWRESRGGYRIMWEEEDSLTCICKTGTDCRTRQRTLFNDDLVGFQQRLQCCLHKRGAPGHRVSAARLGQQRNELNEPSVLLQAQQPRARGPLPGVRKSISLEQVMRRKEKEGAAVSVRKGGNTCAPRPLTPPCWITAMSTEHRVRRWTAESVPNSTATRATTRSGVPYSR